MTAAFEVARRQRAFLQKAGHVTLALKHREGKFHRRTQGTCLSARRPIPIVARCRQCWGYLSIRSECVKVRQSPTWTLETCRVAALATWGRGIAPGDFFIDKEF